MRYVHIVIHNGSIVGSAYSAREKADQKAREIHTETFTKPQVVSLEIL